MPRVRVIAAPRPNLPGVWALGKSPRTGPVDPATGVPTIIPGASGQQMDIDVDDEQLKELQSEPNKSLLGVMVLSEGTTAEEKPQPGTTVLPGTQPTPTTPPAPQGPSPTGEPAPSTPRKATK
jgi:hypothetical protein